MADLTPCSAIELTFDLEMSSSTIKLFPLKEFDWIFSMSHSTKRMLRMTFPEKAPLSIDPIWQPLNEIKLAEPKTFLGADAIFLAFSTAMERLASKLWIFGLNDF